MYRYSPPKSNIWGHSLRKMEPARQRALFDEFLTKATAEHSFTTGSLQLHVGPAPAFLPPEASGMWEHLTSDDVHRFEQLLGTSARESGFYSLSAQQCEAALNEIIRNGRLTPGVILTLGYRISKWLIDGEPLATQSHVMLFYGMKPCISTFLEFETTSQFEYIKQVLSDLDFCRLNDKHLKPIKRGLKNKSGEIGDA